MALKLVTPASALVSLAEAKRHVHAEDFTDDDAYLESLVAVATAWIDGKYGWLGRSIGQQTWDYVLDEFPVGAGPKCGELRIPLPPLQTVTWVKYVSPTTGLEVTLTPDTDYTVDAFSEPGRIMPADNGWPETDDAVNAVRIRFVAGYETVPPSIKHAILLLVGQWYKNREAVTIGDRPEILLFAVDALLLPHRNWIS